MPGRRLALALTGPARTADPPPVVAGVEGQPVAANADRVTKALALLGTPLAPATAKALQAAVDAADATAVQAVLDPRVLFVVSINPEARVKVARGPGDATLQQAGYVPVLVKVVNESTVKKSLKIVSPQGGAVFSGRGDREPTADLSGLKVEYAIALIYSTQAGKREATVGFDLGQGNQDLGFRGEVPVLSDVKPAVAVKLKVVDADGTPTVGRFTFTDAAGHVYPPQAKRLAPDFFFQRQVYRADPTATPTPSTSTSTASPPGSAT